MPKINWRYIREELRRFPQDMLTGLLYSVGATLGVGLVVSLLLHDSTTLSLLMGVYSAVMAAIKARRTAFTWALGLGVLVAWVGVDPLRDAVFSSLLIGVVIGIVVSPQARSRFSTWR